MNKKKTPNNTFGNSSIQFFLYSRIPNSRWVRFIEGWEETIGKCFGKLEKPLINVLADCLKISNKYPMKLNRVTHHLIKNDFWFKISEYEENQCYPKTFLEKYFNSFMTEVVIIQKPVSANQWTGFYMVTASVMKELKEIAHMPEKCELKQNRSSWIKLLIQVGYVIGICSRYYCFSHFNRSAICRNNFLSSVVQDV